MDPDALSVPHRPGTLACLVEGIPFSVPISPGRNDRVDHFQGVADLLASLPNIRKTEVVSYHHFGINKLERYGLEEPDRADTQPPAPDVIEEWIKQFQHLGVEAFVEV